MVWVKTFKKNIKLGMAPYVNIIDGKIVETSEKPKGRWAND